MLVHLLRLWFVFLCLSFVVALFSDKDGLTPEKRIAAVIAIAWIGSNITALLIYFDCR